MYQQQPQQCIHCGITNAARGRGRGRGRRPSNTSGVCPYIFTDELGDQPKIDLCKACYDNLVWCKNNVLATKAWTHKLYIPPVTVTLNTATTAPPPILSADLIRQRQEFLTHVMMKRKKEYNKK